YQGIAESPNGSVPAVPLWIDTRMGDPDPFISQVTITPSSPTPTPSATPTPPPTPPPAVIPVLRLSAAPVSVNEGGDASFTITASAANPSQPIAINYVMSGAAQNGLDYT